MTYGVAVLVIYGRVAHPRDPVRRHQVRVHSVVRGEPRRRQRLPHRAQPRALNVHGGQYLLWRFLTPDLWWRAHPYSVSSGPNGYFLRLTVREVGEHSKSLMRPGAGTRVFIEGPYGRFHVAEHGELADQPLLLVAGGVGVAPVRAILEELGARPGTVVLYRVRSHGDVLFRGRVRAHGRVLRGDGLRPVRQPATSSRSTPRGSDRSCPTSRTGRSSCAAPRT